MRVLAGLLRLVPWWVPAAGVALLLAALVAGLVKQTLRLGQAETALALEQRDRKDERLRSAERALVATDRVRKEEGRRWTAQQEVIRDAEAQLDQARRDRAAADLAAGSLRRRAADLAARCDRPATNPAPAGAGEATAGAGLVLADVLGRSDDTSGELAAAYDDARARGLACERAYDALTAPPQLGLTTQAAW